MRRIEDDLTGMKLTACQKHRIRKRRAGLCGYSGCKEVSHEKDKCAVHAEVVNRYNREKVLSALKSKPK